MTLVVPAPGPWGGAAWAAAVAGTIAIAAARRAPSPPYLLWALLPALLGQVGTWLASPGPGFPLEEPTVAAAALAAAVAPEAHGYLAGACVALGVATAARIHADRARPPASGALAGVVGATVVGAASGAPSVGLGVGAALALAGVLLSSSSREPAAGWAALVGVGLAWLGARHFLLFDLHAPLATGRLDGLVDLLSRRTDALRALTIAGPGWAVAATASAALRPRLGGRRGTLGAAALAAGVVGTSIGGAVNTGALRPVHVAVAGGHLPRGLPTLPEIARTRPAEGRCLAWPAEQGWRLAHRWSAERCGPGGPVVVAAPAEGLAAEVFAAPWLASGQHLEILGAAPVRAPSGPLAALAWRAASVRWVRGPAPEGMGLEDLDRWLGEQLGEAPTAAARGVWIFDVPGGETLRLPVGVEVAPRSRSQRRAIVNRLLRSSERPRLVLVLGDRWTVQRTLDLCVDARASLGPDLPCVWVSPR